MKRLKHIAEAVKQELALWGELGKNDWLTIGSALLALVALCAGALVVAFWVG